MHHRRNKFCCSGHDLTKPGALYVRHDGYTDCRACKRESARRTRATHAIAELRKLREQAMKTSPELVREITAQIAELTAGRPAKSAADLERDLDAAIALELLPRHMRGARA